MLVGNFSSPSFSPSGLAVSCPVLKLTMMQVGSEGVGVACAVPAVKLLLGIDFMRSSELFPTPDSPWRASTAPQLVSRATNRLLEANHIYCIH